MHKIELLSKVHDREGFDCGKEPLNLFLKQTARQHAERGISRTFVLVEQGSTQPMPILGFFSLNLCQVRSESLSPELARKLPRHVPGVKIGRLAVATPYQAQGLGKRLLAEAMHKFLEIFHTAGGIGLFVDAKDFEAKTFYEHFGFVPMASSELELFLPVATIQAAFE